MAERPIIFSGPMVRALLEGRKTQARMVARIKWKEGANPNFSGWRSEQVGLSHWQIIGGMGVGANITTPYAPGDRLWVREAFSITNDGCCPSYLRYRADPEGTLGIPCSPSKAYGSQTVWRPSIHMPRWASRLTLTVTDVRAQRLQDISDDDCVAEGVDRTPTGKMGSATLTLSRPLGTFADIWNSLHGPDAWDANPWVVALTFTVERRNIDEATQ